MSRIRRVLPFLVQHWIFCGAFAVGLAVRVITMLGFPPAIWFGGDSESYLHSAIGLQPGVSRLSGYGAFLYLLRPFHSFALVTAIQHLMGLGAAVLLYALLRRYGLPAWGATLATLPVLADAYLVQLEQEILPSVAFGFLVVTALTLILWWRDGRPLWATAAAAALLAVAATMWPVGLPLLVILLAYLIVRRAGLRALLAAAVAGALPLFAYLGWFDMAYHRFAFSNSDGIYLWSRTMTFANCAIIKPPADELALCPRQPVAQRPSASTFIWEPTSPLNSIPGPNFTPAKNALAMKFALRAIEAQPVSYLHDVLDDFALTFTWNRPAHPSVAMSERYQFAFGTRSWLPATGATGQELALDQRIYTGDSVSWTSAVQPYAGWMRGYQRFLTVRGTMLAVLLLVGLAGVARSWAGGGFRRRSGWGGPALYPWTTAVAMLFIPTATADFSQRYALPAMPVVALAAALAFARPGAGRVLEAAAGPAASLTAPDLPAVSLTAAPDTSAAGLTATPGGPAADAAAVPEPVKVDSPTTAAEVGEDPESGAKIGSTQVGQRD
jgi:hypothetical protein